MGILGIPSWKEVSVQLTSLGSYCESSPTMLMDVVLPCLLGLVVEVWGQEYPPTATYPPPTPSPPAHEPPHHHYQPGYAPAGYAAQGYGAGGGYGKDLMQDPYLLSLLLGGDSGFGGDNLMLMSMMSNKFVGYGGYGGGMMNNPMMMMRLMKDGGLSNNPLAMMAMMGGGKKMNPLLMSALLQCKEEHPECTQPNNSLHECCGLGGEHHLTISGRPKLPCCSCKKTVSTILPVDPSWEG